MKRILYIHQEIKNCVECVWYQTYPTAIFAYCENPARKKKGPGANTVSGKGFPEWCPLEKEEN